VFEFSVAGWCDFSGLGRAKSTQIAFQPGSIAVEIRAKNWLKEKIFS
jgi:hypothetical protein